ncbi:hypothetical protein LTS12_014389 [Elasticomyces elasticus]|nr:hypothetical protein LTS12_014389 [Elasticomyces elasticus]
MALSPECKRSAFCQRLAQALDEADYAMTGPTAATQSKAPYETFRECLARHLNQIQLSICAYEQRTIHNNNQSPFIRLPPEIRQEILDLSVTDSELNHGSKLGRKYRTRSRVCKTMHADMQLVRSRWHVRRRKFLAELRAGRGEFHDYIKELMTPIIIGTILPNRSSTKQSNRQSFYNHHGSDPSREVQRQRLKSAAATSAHRDSYMPSRPATADKRWNARRWELKSKAECDAVEEWRALAQRRKEELAAEKQPAWFLNGIEWKSRKMQHDRRTKVNRRARIQGTR